MKIYNWQQPDWPYFQYDVSINQSIIHEMLCAILEKTGLINGKLSHLTEHLQTVLNTTALSIYESYI